MEEEAEELTERPAPATFTQNVLGVPVVDTIPGFAVLQFKYHLADVLSEDVRKDDRDELLSWVEKGLLYDEWDPDHKFASNAVVTGFIRDRFRAFTGVEIPEDPNDPSMDAVMTRWVEHFIARAERERERRAREYGAAAGIVPPEPPARERTPSTTTSSSGMRTPTDEGPGTPEPSSRLATPDVTIEAPEDPGAFDIPLASSIRMEDVSTDLFRPRTKARLDGEAAPLGGPMMGDAWRFAQIDAATPLEEELGDGNPEIASPQDLVNDHEFSGQRQPPVGMRLRHVLNFLADEDVDRCMYWEVRFREAKEYLQYLQDNMQNLKMGERTKAMLRTALDRVKVHEKFEDYHYNTYVKYRPFDPEKVPKPKPFLADDPEYPVEFAGRRDRAKEKLPHALLRRPLDRINKLWIESDYKDAQLEGARLRAVETLAADEDRWWNQRDAVPGDLNTSFVESKTYEKCLAEKAGWNRDTPHENTLPFPNGQPGHRTPEHFARERGARRAGIQTVLRSMTNDVNRLADSRWRRVTIPNPPELLQKVREEAEGPSGNVIPIKTVDIARLPRSGLETHPYTYWMSVYWRAHDICRREAREVVEEEQKKNENWMSPPLSDRGPYVYRGVPASVQRDQDMHKRLSALLKMVERQINVAPRPLMESFGKYVKMGMYGRGPPPAELGGKGLPLIKEADVRWIEHLTRNSINVSMNGKLYPRGKLFLTFYERLMRLMDDVSPQALWPTAESKVPVERLLEVMNRGLGEPETNNEVTKTKFLIYDVLMWLDRLAKAGRCRFQEDIRCYGWVMRYEANVHPEHQLTWNAAKNEPGRVRSWTQAIRDKAHEQRTPPEIDYFCKTLGYRMGVHLRRYDQILKPQHPQHLMERRLMNVALNEWETAFVEMSRSGQVATIMDAVSYAEPARHRPGMLYAEALAHARQGVIDECVRNDAMLFPVRPKRYSTEEGHRGTALTHPPLWEGAHRRVRGRSGRFFSVNRWPLELLSEEARERVTSDEDLDKAAWLYDPLYEDPCVPKYCREKAEPYGDDKVVYRWGPRVYAAGDTPYQRARVEHHLTSLVREALGDTDPPRPGLLDRLTGWFRPTYGDGRLPDVPDELVPKSFDPEQRAWELKRAEDARLAAEGGRQGHQGGNHGDDVEMTDASAELGDFQDHSGNLRLEARFRIA
ncbi:hypothetical protein NKR23_g11034 [Pleurostoma richardsiae]|uniref:Uncharacterized protein n=1 Tax=Pleurostoma richardsiae TaxID=41990 RepID=A0AA38VHR8_9PEZI|nr:hypothetical protein NKR23_g11034 [Pleurostoma richardsiae]